MIFLVPLSQGQYAIIDDIDAERALPHKWSADRRETINGPVYYAYRFDRPHNPGRKVYLHCFILSLPKGVLTDHKDGNTLDCRRSNLRPSTYSQNASNRAARGRRSRFKGVAPAPKQGRWEARVGSPTTYIGTFDSEEMAAIAYDCAARAKWGDFARPNFPLEGRCRS